MASSQENNGGCSGRADMVAQVERMVYQLYQDQNPESRSVADQWLQSLQSSEHAWSLAWPLLQHQEVAVQNYGALMLHNKISKSWSELPSTQYESLRVELFAAIARCSARGPRLVLIQLCRCMVAFAFATMSDVWPNTIVSMVHSLKDATQSVQDADFTISILQLLTILPEEYERTCDHTVAAKRGILRHELKKGLPTVLSLLEEVVVSAQSENVKLDAMKCFSSWVEFGLPLPEVQGFIGQLLQGLLNEELFSQSCETLTDIVSKEDSMKYPIALRNILQQVTGLRELCKNKLDSSDKEGAATLSRMIVEVGDSNMTVLVDEVGREESGEGGREGGGDVGDMGGSEEQRGEMDDNGGEAGQLALDISQLLLEFLSVPGYYPVDELCSEITFRFWDNLLEGIAMTEPHIHKCLVEFYGPTLTSVIEVFPEKAQYPPEEEWQKSWSEDDRDSFAKYREDMCDLAEALQKSMHFEYLQHLSSILTHLLSNSTSSSWQSVESVLFLLQGVSSHVTQHSSPLLHSILSQFPHMPPHPTLIRTALNLLGCLSSWFRAHPDLLQAVLPIILDGLSNASLATSAALAFRDVCAECAEQLAPVVMQIIPSCQVGLSNTSLSPQDSVRLVAAIGSVLSSMPVKMLLPALETLVTSRVQSLQSLAVQEASEASKPLVERELTILSAFCHHIYPTLQEGEQHPVILLFLQLWPSLQRLISQWCSDQDVVESICICWNRAMRTVQEQYIPLLEGTVELIIKCYAAVHYAKLLDSAAQLVQLFGKETSCSGLISPLLQQLHSLSLPFFQSALVEYPDTLQSYLRLMSAALKSCPALLLTINGISQNLFDIGLAGLERPEQPTVICASSFFTSYLKLVESSESIQSVVSEKGVSLVQYILQAIAGAAPRSYLTSFTEVLVALCIYCTSQLSQWLEELLSQDGFPSHHVSLTEKHDFKTTVLRQRGQLSGRLLKDKVKEFSLMCRGFHGTLYALQTS